MRVTRRHKDTIRTVAFGVALVVFGSSLTAAPVVERGSQSTALLANTVIGVFAGVPENPINTKALALMEKEAELSAREAALGATAATESSSTDLISFASLAISSLVLLLVALNFYYDRQHAIEERRGPLITLRR